VIPPAGRLAGRVAAFDDEVGLGEVEAPAGRWPFHCTAIAGGSRTIAAGAVVTFEVAAGRSGRWEAVDVRAGG
jgi:cold shock CspA family protein